MTWSRKDIIAAIERLKLDVDTGLPYWELKRRYIHTRYIRSLLGHGSRSQALGVSHTPPPDASTVNDNSMSQKDKDGVNKRIDAFKAEMKTMGIEVSVYWRNDKAE